MIRKLRGASRLAAALVAVTVLSACGTGGGAGSGADAGTLRVWFPGNLSEEIAWVNEKLVPAFKAEHGVDVQVEFVDWANLATRLSTAFAGGTAPDVFGHGNAAAAGYAANNRVIALDEYLAKMPADDVADLTFLDQGKVNGKQVIMPLRGFGHLLAYRADLVKEAGLDPDSPPRTWQELRSAADRLVVRKSGSITRSGVIVPADDPTSMSQAFGSFLFQAGGAFLDESGTTITWNSEAGKRALGFLVDLYNGPQAVSTGLGEATSGAGAQHPLVTGRAAMAVITEATLKSIHEQAPDVAAQIKVAPPLKDAVAASFGGAGNGLFISADSKHKDQAWEFIEFLLKPANAKAYVQAVGGIPARASLASDPDLAAKPYIKPYMDAASQFRGNPNVETWTQQRDALSAEIEAALRGKAPAGEALDRAAAKATALLKRN
ncbi:ABC transporter substrate-binding protein [Microtetraspora fusca]|uniref:ABC transporter substrate-binding protein n=1 Tax=Microtetraspora fusca TaxID=1997 RepID=UPI0008356A6C|nr:ABC transporter substrate-binding protein [Microtetraspora fusca]